MPGANAQIIELRKLLAERFLAPALTPGRQLITEIPMLDQTGGLSKGAITEVISAAPSAGSAMLIHALLERARRERFFLALIDGRDSFDLETLSPMTLAHLLWVRCGTAAEAMKGADFLLRDGNFPLVILDLVMNPTEELRRIPATTWYRLQRLVEPTSTAFLVLSRHNLAASAQLKITLENNWALSDLARDEAMAQVRGRIRRAHKIRAAN